MKIKKSIQKIVFITAVISMAIMGCDDPYKSVDYSKLEAEEKALLDKYLVQNLESLSAEAIDTIHNKKNGLIYFEMETGTGDSILPGNVVGFRYKYYELGLDKDDKPTLYPWVTNKDEVDPYVYKVGVPNNVAFWGVDQGIKYMHHLGKSKIIIPSALATNNYITIVAEIEVTYLVNR